MKIAFPVMDESGYLADHFGRAGKFAVFDDKTKVTSFIENTGEHFGGQHPAPVVLKNNEINVLICKGLGIKAINLFEELGIGVYITSEQKVQQALDAYLAGNLTKATKTDGCSGHGHH